MKRCEAPAKRGTGIGTCDRPLDESGRCDNWRDHLGGPEDFYDTVREEMYRMGVQGPHSAHLADAYRKGLARELFMALKDGGFFDRYAEANR